MHGILCIWWFSYLYMSSKGLFFIVRHDRNWDFPKMINISGVGESLFGWPSSNQMACRWWATWTCALKTQPACVFMIMFLFAIARAIDACDYYIILYHWWTWVGTVGIMICCYWFLWSIFLSSLWGLSLLYDHLDSLMTKLFILMIRCTTQEFTSNTKHVALEDDISFSIGTYSGCFAIGLYQMCIHPRTIVAEALLWPKGSDPY